MISTTTTESQTDNIPTLDVASQTDDIPTSNAETQTDIESIHTSSSSISSPLDVANSLSTTSGINLASYLPTTSCITPILDAPASHTFGITPLLNVCAATSQSITSGINPSRLESDPTCSIAMNHEVDNIVLLHNSLTLPNDTWKDVTKNFNAQSLTKIHLCKIELVSLDGKQLLVVTYSLTVHTNLSWSLFVHNHAVCQQNCTALSSVPCTLSVESINGFLELLDKLSICRGQPDSHFILMSKRMGLSTD